MLLQFISAPLLYLSALLLAVVIIVNLLACIMIFIAELEGEEKSWMAYACTKELSVMILISICIFSGELV